MIRMGGDEFAVVMPGASAGQARKVADWLRTRFDAASNVEMVSVGVGFAWSGGPKPIALQDLFQRADADMYANKTLKRGRSAEEPTGR